MRMGDLEFFDDIVQLSQSWYGKDREYSAISSRWMHFRQRFTDIKIIIRFALFLSIIALVLLVYSIK